MEFSNTSAQITDTDLKDKIPKCLPFPPLQFVVDKESRSNMPTRLKGTTVVLIDIVPLSLRLAFVCDHFCIKLFITLL